MEGRARRVFYRAVLNTVFDKAKAYFHDLRLRRRRAALASQGFRIVRISFPNRIGHLCVDIDALLKDTILQGGDTHTFYLPDIGNGFANRHVVDYYRKYLTIGPDLDLPKYPEPLPEPADIFVDTHPYAVAMYKTAREYEVYAKWGDRPPLFEVSADDIEARARYFRSIGLPEDAWFVCLHAREGGYSTIDEGIHRHRSIDVDSFRLAVQEIVERGGYVFRMGDPTMRPFTPHPHVIDYALSPQRSPQLDVALTGSCRFFLGSASGLFSLAQIFGRPCAVAHMSPLAGSLSPAPADISIPQHLTTAEGRTLAITEIMAGDAANYRLDGEFTAAGLKHVPNSPEEIREITLEMIERLDGVAQYTDDDIARQTAFRALHRDGHFAFRAASSLGRDFLRRHMPHHTG